MRCGGGNHIAVDERGKCHNCGHESGVRRAPDVVVRIVVTGAAASFVAALGDAKDAVKDFFSVLSEG